MFCAAWPAAALLPLTKNGLGLVLRSARLYVSSNGGCLKKLFQGSSDLLEYFFWNNFDGIIFKLGSGLRYHPGIQNKP